MVFLKLIIYKLAWNHDSGSRLTMSEIFLRMNDLNTEYEDLNLTSEIAEELELYRPESRITIQEGIIAHKNKNMELAWECFNYHANLGNILAKYWKGYYLWEGYCCEKDKLEAAKLFKEAADDGIPEAQLRYAFTLTENKHFDKNSFFLYLTRAADSNNIAAQYNLADIYFNGKLGKEKDQELGKILFQIAAENGHPKAKDLLNTLKCNIYD